jgi:hypothetical protein
MYTVCRSSGGHLPSLHAEAFSQVLEHTNVNLKGLDILIGTSMGFVIKMLEQAKATSSY